METALCFLLLFVSLLWEVTATLYLHIQSSNQNGNLRFQRDGAFSSQLSLPFKLLLVMGDEALDLRASGPGVGLPQPCGLREAFVGSAVVACSALVSVKRR